MPAVARRKGCVDAVTALARESSTPWARPYWPADVQAALAETHLAAWCKDANGRQRFASSLHHFLTTQPDTEVWTIGGPGVSDVDAICRQVAMCFPIDVIEPRIHGLRGLTDALRRPLSDIYGTIARFRYIIWHDADHLLRADRDLFGQVVDAIAGVAAEGEYASERLLTIQRAVFVGGPDLAAYGDDPRGQFRSWYRFNGEPAFWAEVTGQDEPEIRVETVDRLLDGGVI